MTQVQLAEKVGVSKGTVAMWEVNKQETSFEMLIKLSKLFDVSIDFLIRGYELRRIFYMNEAIRELNAMKARIPQQTYRTIIGQMRAGDLGGATVGINRLKKKLAKEDAANENCSRK